MKNSKHILPIRVYYEDTDAGGVVYHSQYLNFMERARTEMLRALGFDQDILAQECGVLFVVRSLQIDYLKPGRFNEILEIKSHVAELGRASATFIQEVWRAEDALRLPEQLVSASVNVVCVGSANFKPCVIPDTIRESLNSGN